MSCSTEAPTAQKMKFTIKDCFKTVDLATFAEEILNGKLHFLCSFLIPRSFQNWHEKVGTKRVLLQTL